MEAIIVTATGSSLRRTASMFALLVVGFVVGYFVRTLRTRSKHYPVIAVNEGWVSEARTCWKGFANWTDSDILTGLASAPRFRDAFQNYHAYTDQKIGMIAKSAPALEIGPDKSWLPNTPKMSPQELGARVKAKYPEYNDMGDLDVARAVIKKFPAYNDLLDDPYFASAVPIQKSDAASEYYSLAPGPCNAAEGLPHSF